MSRFGCVLYKKTILGKQLIDDNCTIGYDEPMQTYFFQSGHENEFDEPAIWLGTALKQFLHLSEIETTLKTHKYILEIDQLTRKQLECI